MPVCEVLIHLVCSCRAHHRHALSSHVCCVVCMFASLCSSPRSSPGSARFWSTSAPSGNFLVERVVCFGVCLLLRGWPNRRAVTLYYFVGIWPALDVCVFFGLCSCVCLLLCSLFLVLLGLRGWELWVALLRPVCYSLLLLFLFIWSWLCVFLLSVVHLP